jgi:CDP-diacylglycerol--serine O-phosphatidyltransferase
MLITSWSWLAADGQLAVSPWMLAALAVVCSGLLISPIRMFSLKFTDFSWKHNALRYCFAAVSVVGIIFAGVAAIPAIIGLYIIVSTITWMTCKK